MYTNMWVKALFPQIIATDGILNFFFEVSVDIALL